MKILILCTGNTCRSQMAEGFLKAFDATLQVYSAGTKPETKVNPFAIEVMLEVGIDISRNRPKPVEDFIDKSFDYVITVCDGAKEICPVFTGKVTKRLHIGFEDPAGATGSDIEKLQVFREVRNKILLDFFTFYQKQLQS
jgi:arsenate reductase